MSVYRPADGRETRQQPGRDGRRHGSRKRVP